MRKKVAKKQKNGEMHPYAKILKTYIYLMLLGTTLAIALIIQRSEIIMLLTK